MAETDAAAFDALRRAEFGALQDIYFNAASYGPLPARGRAAAQRALQLRSAGALGAADFAEAAAAARAAAAALVGADAAEIALTPNTSYGLNLAAAALAARRRQRDPRRTIVVSRGEFPANVYPWLALGRDGYSVRFVELAQDGAVDEDALADAAAGDDAALLALSAVQFATGYRADLARLGSVCARHDVLFVVDAIQQLGALPLDLAECHIDILAAGGQKWLCSPFGTGFACLRGGIARDAGPLVPGWTAFEASADYTSVVDYRYVLVGDARRFEAGTLPFHDLTAFSAACELIREIGVSAIAAHIAAVQAPLRAWAAHRGVAVAGGDAPGTRSGILALRLNRSLLERALHALHAHRVACVVREGALRFSPHLYNTVTQAEHVAAVLDSVVAP